MVKSQPTVWETQVRTLGWEDPLEKEWQPTLVHLPGKSHGWRRLAGYSPWGLKESEAIELARRAANSIVAPFLSFFPLFFLPPFLPPFLLLLAHLSTALSM